MLRVELVGAARLKRTLRQAGRGVADLKAANRAAVEVVQPYARVRAPRGPDVGGHIRDTVRVGATARQGVIRVGSRAKPYAGPIHWGWPKRGIRPQPWVADAAKATETKWVSLYLKHVNEMLDLVEGL